jgi:hypothetical protein
MKDFQSAFAHIAEAFSGQGGPGAAAISQAAAAFSQPPPAATAPSQPPPPAPPAPGPGEDTSAGPAGRVVDLPFAAERAPLPEDPAVPDIEALAQEAAAPAEPETEPVDDGAAPPEERDTPADTSQVDENDLDPETRKKLRVMRRLTGGTVSDQELLARIRADGGPTGDGGGSGKKRRWWGG